MSSPGQGMHATVTPWAGVRRAACRTRGRAVARALRLGVPMAAVLLLTAAGWPSAATAPASVPGGWPTATPAPTATQAPASRQRVQPDLLIVAPRSLPANVATTVQRMRGVQAAVPVDAAQVQVNGKYTQMLGVDPATFRSFAARPTARQAGLWRNVTAGQMAVSYTMGKQDRLPAGATAHVAGQRLLSLRIGGIGTVGIAGVDAVISRSVASRLGFPAGNAMVVSAPHTSLTALKTRVAKLLPKAAQVQILAAPGRPADTVAGAQGTRPAAPGHPVASGSGLTYSETLTMLRAALSRVGMPYVWGAAGPSSFDCSGLVQWSFAQAGIVMPRVAADQALTGPAVPGSQLQPGDLLFYHTDPTAPGYISHVTIYLGRGQMVQAPQPGMDVQVVPVDLGPDFAGAVQVVPGIAAQVAGVPVG